jgi:hypothetical protein
MAKATLTIEDDANGQITVNCEFDPTLNRDSTAHFVAAQVLAFIKSMHDGDTEATMKVHADD